MQKHKIVKMNGIQQVTVGLLLGYIHWDVHKLLSLSDDRTVLLFVVNCRRMRGLTLEDSLSLRNSDTICYHRNIM